MVWKKMIILVIVLAIIVSALALLRVYRVREGAVGAIIWNSHEAYLFVDTFQYGYNLSYLGYLGEVFKEIFPFGATSPEKKHFRMMVVHISAEANDRFFVDNFHVGSPPFAAGQNVYAANLSAEPGPLKWSGTHFEPMTSEEQSQVRDARNSGGIPASPSYDNIGGWSRRMLDLVSSENDTKITMEIDGKQLAVLAHSGERDHEAYIDVTRPGRPPDRAWQLNEGFQRVNKATYKQIFGDN
jgi:hypothetical protein